MPTSADNEKLEALHVIVDNSSAEKDVAADWGSWQTFTTTPTTPPQQILPQNDKRKEAELIVFEGLPGSATQSFTGEGSVTNPAAFATIASTPNVPAGLYQVTATVYLSGTVTGADGNNMFIGGSGIPAHTLAYPGVVNSPVTYTTTIYFNGTGNVMVQASSAASGASAIYNASIVVTPLASGGFVRVGTRGQVMNNQGGALQAGRFPYEAKQELWMGSDGATTMTVVVLDERYE